MCSNRNDYMIDFSYKNECDTMVVFRCIGPQHFFLERVLFPSEVISILAPEGSRVEIWGNHAFGPQLEQRMRITNIYEETPLAA